MVGKTVEYVVTSWMNREMDGEMENQLIGWVDGGEMV